MQDSVDTDERKHHGGLPNWVRRRWFAVLSVLVLALTWAFMLPQVAADRGLIPVPNPILTQVLQGWMPGLAGVAVAAMTTGRAGVRELLGRFLIWRVSFGWYLLALLGPAAFFLAGAGLLALIGGKSGPLPIQQLPAGSWAPNLIMMVLLGAIFNTEEIAWRGFALPRLRPLYGALLASLIIAVPWYVFHLPLLFAPSNPLAEIGPYGLFVQIVSLSVILSWAFVNTRGSLIIVTLFHAAANAWPGLLATGDVRAFYLTDAVMLAFVLVLVLVYGPDLARQKKFPAPVPVG